MKYNSEIDALGSGARIGLATNAYMLIAKKIVRKNRFMVWLGWYAPKIGKIHGE
jgi:hypothetical protein